MVIAWLRSRQLHVLTLVAACLVAGQPTFAQPTAVTLSDQEKERILLEERYRQEVRARLVEKEEGRRPQTKWRDLMWPDIIQTAAVVATAIGVIAGIYFGVRQLRVAVAQLEGGKRTQQAQTLLAFDQMLDRHEAVHKKLRPGGAWAGVEAELEPA